jgi:hypothetical protein
MTPEMAKDFSGPQAPETLRAMADLFSPSLAVVHVEPVGQDQATVSMNVAFPQGFTAKATLGTALVGDTWKVTGAHGALGPTQ